MYHLDGNSGDCNYFLFFLFEKEAYGMKSLLPEDWDDLVHRMASNTTLFNTFYK